MQEVVTSKGFPRHNDARWKRVLEGGVQPKHNQGVYLQGVEVTEDVAGVKT